MKPGRRTGDSLSESPGRQRVLYRGGDLRCPGPGVCIVMLYLSPLIEDRARSVAESARNRVGKWFSFICFLVYRLQEHFCFSQPDQHINIYNQLFLVQTTCYRLWKQGAYALPHRSLWELVCVSNFGEQMNKFRAPGTARIPAPPCPLAWECSNHISVVHDVSAIGTHFPYFMISIFWNIHCLDCSALSSVSKSCWKGGGGLCLRGEAGRMNWVSPVLHEHKRFFSSAGSQVHVSLRRE